MVIQDEHLEPLEALERVAPTVLSDDELRAAADAASRKAQVAEARAEQWAQVAMNSRREEQHYLQILALRNGEAPNATSNPPRTAPVVDRSSDGQAHPVIAASMAVLRDAGRPLHIGELMRSLQEQGVAIPGSGEQANLISYLRRDNRIVRPSRGVYGLAEWGLAEMAPPPKRRKKKRIPRGRSGR